VTAPINIEVPGRGLVNLQAMRVDEAVRGYDERLRFGFNTQNGDWVIYIQLPRDFEHPPYRIDGEPMLPVLGFGHDIPSVDYALKRLDETDAMKHGSKIYDKMLAHNEAIKKEQEEKWQEQLTEAAERMEHALRKEGQGSSTTKIFFQKGRRR
jgi:hypothetical protein